MTEHSLNTQGTTSSGDSFTPDLNSFQKLSLRSSLVKKAAIIAIVASCIGIVVQLPRGEYLYVATWACIIFFNLIALFQANKNTNRASIWFICSIFVPTLVLNIIQLGAIPTTYTAIPALTACMVAMTNARLAFAIVGCYSLVTIVTLCISFFYFPDNFAEIYASSGNAFAFEMSLCLSLSIAMTSGAVGILKSTYVKAQTELVEAKNKAENLKEQVTDSLKEKSSLLDMAMQMQQIGNIRGYYYYPQYDQLYRLKRDTQTYAISTLEESNEYHRKIYGTDSQMVNLVKQALIDKQDWDTIIEAKDREDNKHYMQVKGFLVKNGDDIEKIVVVVNDITEIKLLQNDLAHSQKLEAVGQMAAGIAHEINTPAQFVSDNLAFMKDGVHELFDVIEDINKLTNDTDKNNLHAEIAKLISESDIDFLKEEIPAAMEQSFDGINRVAKIVRAMKDYSHPGEAVDMADINTAIESTVTISKSEWKYSAEVEMELEPGLPLVECVLSDINQVVLNMIVNAAHAISEKSENPDPPLGLIKLKTRTNGDCIEIIITDNGNGIPEEIQNKVFDPFFTTKAVGKGTGQGLHIAHNIIVKKHGGELAVESNIGEGTSFTITLPQKMAETQQKIESAA